MTETRVIAFENEDGYEGESSRAAEREKARMVELRNQVIARMTSEEARKTLKVMKGALSVAYFRRSVGEVWDRFHAVWRSLASVAFSSTSESVAKEGIDLEKDAASFTDDDSEFPLLEEGNFPSPESVEKGKVEWQKRCLCYKFRVVSAKRKAILGKRKERMKAMMESCVAVLNGLISHRFGRYLARPMAKENMDLREEDYRKVYRRTADITSLKARVLQGKYKRPSEVAEEVRTILNNIIRYYRPSPRMAALHMGQRSQMVAMAEEMIRFFEESFAATQEMMEEDKRLKAEEADALYPPKSTVEGVDWDSLRRGLQKVQFQLRQARAGEGRGKRRGAPKPKWRIAGEELRELSEALGKLPEVVLDHLVEIVWGTLDEPIKTYFRGKMWVEMSTLDNDTLWALRHLASGGGATWRSGGEEGRRRRKAEVGMLTFAPSVLTLEPHQSPLLSTALRGISTRR